MAQHSHKTAAEFVALAATITAYPELTGTLTYLGPDGAGATAPFDGITATPNTMIDTVWRYTLGADTYDFSASYAEMVDKLTAIARITSALGIDGYAIELKAAILAMNTAIQLLTDPDEILAMAHLYVQQLPNQASWT